MEIEIEGISSGNHLVRCAGEFRADDGVSMHDELHPLIAEAGTGLVVDLSGVSWIDSGGLSHLISLVTHSRLSKSRVVLAAPSPFVAGVLEVTGLDSWFEVAEDADSAGQRRQAAG